MATSNKVTQKQKIFTGLILAVSVYLINLIIFYTNNNCLPNYLFVSFRILLAIAVLLIASGTSGFFEIPGVIKVTGAVGFACLIYYYTPIVNNNCDKPFIITVYLRDKNGNIALKNEGILYLTYGNKPDPQRIDENGSCTFKEIPSNYLGMSCDLQIEALGWSFNNQKKIQAIQLDGKSKKIIIQRDSDFCCVRGIVQDNAGNLLSGVKVTISGESSITNDNGYFLISLPENKQNEIYRIQASKEGYYTRSYDSIPAYSNKDEIIVLEKK